MIWIAVLTVAVCCLGDFADAQDQRLILVQGTGGQEQYEELFRHWSEHWKTAAAHTELVTIGGAGPSDESGDSKTDKEKLQDSLSQSSEDLQELWIVFNGHGTFDGKRARFNLEGPDIAATELAEWLRPVRCRIVLINCASSSSPFINELSGPNRIIVTATKNGYQYNFARFGQYLSEYISDPAIDLDKDGQTSLLEAFCAASSQVQNFYDQERRLATEQALLDDNGDKLGTPADWFVGTRVNRRPKSGLADGLLANQVFLLRTGINAQMDSEQRQLRDEIEKQISKLRLQQSTLSQEQYLAQLEPLMIQLAQLYESAEQNSAGQDSDSAQIGTPDDQR